MREQALADVAREDGEEAAARARAQMAAIDQELEAEAVVERQALLLREAQVRSVRASLEMEHAKVRDLERRRAGIVSGPEGAETRREEWRLVPPPEERAIVLGRESLYSVAELSLTRLLSASGPPLLFQRDGELVTLKPVAGSAPRIRLVSPGELRGWLDLQCRYVQENKRGELTPSHCPAEVAMALWARSPWGYFPELEAVVPVPVYGKRGELTKQSGYHPGAKLYYHAGFLTLGSLDLTPGGLWKARELLVEELLGEFPFADEASLAGALALVLTPFVRRLCGDLTPMFGIDAPSAGTGKSLLAAAAISVFDPSQAAATTPTRESEEWRKLIPTLLLQGRSHIWLDNLSYRLDSGELAMALTCGRWLGRRLGGMEAFEAPCRVTWVATANNLSLSPELLDRTCWIRLDARRANPGERSGFRHDPLLLWIGEKRPELLSAVYTLVEHWKEQGCPGPEPALRWRTFSDWASVVGGILRVACVPGFLANQGAFKEKADVDQVAWVGFLTEWYSLQRTAEVGVSWLQGVADGVEGFSEKLGDGNEQSRRSRLGRLLARHEGRIFGKYRIERGGVYQGSVRWRLGTEPA